MKDNDHDKDDNCDGSGDGDDESIDNKHLMYYKVR